MENERSSVDILKDIAKQADWEFNIKETIINARFGHTTCDASYKLGELLKSKFNQYK